MSQSSETMTGIELLALGYPEQHFSNNYYTAKVCETHGVCIARMMGAIFIQFFPWSMPQYVNQDDGHRHQRYAGFITRQASSLDDKYKGLPYEKLPLDTDLLTIKCVIEEGIKQCEQSTVSR